MEHLAEAFQLHSMRDSSSAHGSAGNLGAGSLLVTNVGEAEGIPAYSVKVEARRPTSRPAITGLVHLFDKESGSLLATLESSFVTAVGSALTGALASDLLASPEARSVAVIGNGTQGWLGLRFLMEMRGIETVTLFDLNRKRSRRIADRLSKYEGLKVRVCDSLTEAVSNSDIISCATWSKKPFLYSEMIKPGAHISTLGSDELGKRELSQELLESSSFFCDDRDMAVSVGALQGLRRGSELIVGELGEILSGQVTGRRNSEEITVYGAVGLPFIDLIASWVVFNKAQSKRLGSRFEPLR